MTYEILYRFRPDGTLRGSHVRDWAEDGKSAGPARRMTQADLDAIGSTLDLAHVRRLEELQAELERLKAEHAEETMRLKAEHAETITAMQTATADGDLADRLATIYNTLSPAHQVAFSGELVTILGLLDRGRLDLAAARLAGIPVPEELEEKRAEMLAALSAE